MAKKVFTAMPASSMRVITAGAKSIDQAKRMKDLERENARLKRVVKAMLQEVASGNF